MGWRLEAFKAAISGRPDRMQQFFTSRMTSPPDRNTQEFLATYARSPRLSPVTKIATDLSNVPGKLFRVAANGDKDEITDHPFLDFMARPNPLPFMTRSALWKVHETYLMIKGEGAAIIERDAAGYPVELWPIPPHWMTDIPRLDFPCYTIRSRDGLQMTVPIEDVFLVRQLNPLDPYGRGLGDAEAVADEIETDEYMAKWAKKFFWNDATPPVLMSAPGITQDEYNRFKAAWDDQHRGVGNAHKMGIIPRDVTVNKLVDSQREMDFTQSRKDLRDGVNAHFGVPPEILGIVENSNRATATQAKIIYAENVLTPRLLARQDAINTQLLPVWGEDLLWEYDDIVPEDTEFRLQMSNAGLSGSAIMVDEWREQNGFDPLPNGAGQVLFVPYTPLPADIVFFKDKKSTAESTHTGLVEYAKDGVLHTIEGNTSNAVKRRQYDLNDTYIVGYAAPDYGKENIDSMTKDELKQLIREVIAEDNPTYADLKDVPAYWQEQAKALLDAGAVNGGTPADVNPTDLNLRHETLKAVIIASLYHDANTPEK